MALVKISDLALFTGTPAVGDMYEYVDISEALDADKSKRILGNKIALFLPAQLANNIVETAAIKDGEVTLAKLNADAIPDAVMASKTAVQSIPNNTDTLILWNAESYDHGGLHSTVSNTGRLTAVKAGIYAWTFNGKFDGGGTGYRQIQIFINGAIRLSQKAYIADSGNGDQMFSLAGETELSLNDYIVVSAKHSAGAALNFGYSSAHYPSFSMHYIRAN